MTATAAEATHMAHTPDSQPDPDPVAAKMGSRRWAALGDMLLPTLLATAVVGLLIYSLADERSRIDRLEDTLNTRFAATDAKIDGVGTGLSAKIDEVDARLSAKIDGLDARLSARIDEVDARLSAKIDEVDTGLSARIDGLDDKLHRIDLKLTALIAALNKTGEVEAALEGRLLDSEPAS
ncbi:MAG: hypothetical protein OXH67_06485 [Acidimicrobiaceae bacterium]|nr:hypothetical protein [Acidimicrobiaceae bacterium]